MSAPTVPDPVSDTARHDRLAVGAPCPLTGKPFDGFSWSDATCYDSCRACNPTHPMARGMAVNLRELAEKRAGGHRG